MKRLIIAIDGPAGSGKSTAGRGLAGRLGYGYISTGLLYRAVSWRALELGLAVDDDQGLGDLLSGLELEFRIEERRESRVRLDGRDITDSLHTEDVSQMASAVSARPVVRAGLLDLQRRLGREGGVVIEGRDIGTVVFPEAEVKFFLEARPEERARRRHRELEGRGEGSRLERVAREMARRDHDDSTRELAPLRPALDAEIIDTTHLTLKEVVDRMEARVRSLGV